MKKIISIAFAAILAGLAISCQKEEAVSDKADAVQYTFNITVNDRSGFDNGASTKGDATYKSAWENGDKIFLFFKPTEGSLLDDKYATLTYNGSSWDGTVSSGTLSLGDGGTLSAVYVYKLGSSVTPSYSDSKWIIATGNTFYNCQTGVDYTVSGDVISATLNLVAPTNFVQFYVTSATGALTCDNVKGWKNIAIGSDMAISNVTCTGYMDGFDNSGDSNVKEYYGRIVDGTSLDGKACEFSVVKNGKVYEHTATPSSDARSFKMTVSTPDWQEAEGKLPGLFTVGIGADGKAGTADDVKVRFSQGNLKYNQTAEEPKWKFYDHQYDYLKGYDNSPVSLFPWGYDATKTIFLGSNEYVTKHTNVGDKLVYDKASSEGGDDWGVAYCESNSIDVGTWRTLSKEEWEYLIKTRTMTNSNKDRYSIPEYGVTIGSTTYGGLFLYPDNYNGEVVSGSMTWDAINAAGIVFLPAAGYYDGGHVSGDGTEGFYWSSSAISGYVSDLMYFANTGVVNPSKGDEYGFGDRQKNYSVRLVTEVK